MVLVLYVSNLLCCKTGGEQRQLLFTSNSKLDSLERWHCPSSIAAASAETWALLRQLLTDRSWAMRWWGLYRCHYLLKLTVVRKSLLCCLRQCWGEKSSQKYWLQSSAVRASSHRGFSFGLAWGEWGQGVCVTQTCWKPRSGFGAPFPQGSGADDLGMQGHSRQVPLSGFSCACMGLPPARRWFQTACISPGCLVSEWFKAGWAVCGVAECGQLKWELLWGVKSGCCSNLHGLPPKNLWGFL